MVVSNIYTCVKLESEIMMMSVVRPDFTSHLKLGFLFGTPENCIAPYGKLTLLHPKRPKLYAILVFLSVIDTQKGQNCMQFWSECNRLNRKLVNLSFECNMKFTLSKPPLLQMGMYLVVNCKANHGFIVGDLTLWKFCLWDYFKL